MARNRKRRGAGRERRPGPAHRPGVATAGDDRHDEAPDPIEHATPDVELAEAQLAVGRPEYAQSDQDAGEGEEPSDAGLGDDDAVDPDDADLESVGDGGGGGYDEDDDLGPEDGGPGDGRKARSTEVSAPRERAGSRLVHFVQGSWRELQRVQWPDRRQVMQATGVVIGFVIVAGVFLGVADFVATKIVKLILP